MSTATLVISSRNYSSWSLRGWLLTRLSGLPFEVQVIDDDASRAELLMRASSIRVPCLVHDGLSVWDTLAIAEYLNELRPEAAMLPAERVARARCRSIAGEIHSGFSALRSALPMNLRAQKKNFAVWSGAKGGYRGGAADLARLPRHLARPLSVRRHGDHRGRHVCPGGHPLPHLWRGARRAMRRLLPSGSWRCRTWPSGSRHRRRRVEEVAELELDF